MNQGAIELHIVHGQGDQHCSAVALLVECMYEEEAELGSLARLIPDGAAIWVKSVVSQPAALGRLIIARSGGEVVGFARGTTGMLPVHEGGALLGTITHVFVPPSHRRKGIAKILVGALGEWFTARGVIRTELNVVPGNPDALAFWNAMGYKTMLHHMFKSN